VSLPVAWLGVDPGAKSSGLLSLIDGDVFDVHVLERDVLDNDTAPSGVVEHEVDYARRVADRARAMHGRLQRELKRRTGNSDASVHTAIEGVVAIVPHVRNRPINPIHLIHTAITLGAVAREFPTATIVRPGGHGSNPLGMYPPDLVTAGERRRTGWQLRVGQSSSRRHARSAFDVITAAQSPAYVLR
jgi:hypothetical protein